MSGSRPVLSEARHVLASRLLLPLSSFALLILIGRHSDQLLGEYALVTTVYFVMQTLPLLGLSPFVMREAARDPSRTSTLLVGIGALAMAAAAVLAGGWWLIKPWVHYPPTALRALDVVAIGISWGIVAYLCEALLTAQQRARVVARVALAENLLRLLASLAVLAWAPSVALLFAVFFAGRLLALMVFALALLRQGLAPVRWAGLKALARQVRPQLPAFLGATLLALAASRLDYLMLSVHADLTVLGHYAVSYRYLEIASMFVLAVATALYPRLSRLHHDAPGRHRIVSLTLIDMAMVALPMLAIGALMGADLYVAWLFPRQNPSAVPLAQCFGALIALAGFDPLLTSLLQSTDGQNEDFRAQLMGTLVLAGALALLVPPYLGWGAFWAAAGALLVQAVLRLHVIGRRLAIALPWRRIARMALLAAATLVLLQQAAHGWSQPARLLGIVVLPVAFALVAWLAGGLQIGAWLRALARPVEPGEPLDDARLPHTLRIVAADLRARDAAFAGTLQNHGACAVVLYRMARWLTLNGHRFLGRLVWQLNLLVSKAELPPTTRIGPGFVVTHSVGLIAVGQAGARLTMRAWSAFGVRGRSDAGAGQGMPNIGDGVDFEVRSALHGGLRCDDGTRFPAHQIVVTGRRLAAIAPARKEPA